MGIDFKAFENYNLNFDSVFRGLNKMNEPIVDPNFFDKYKTVNRLILIGNGFDLAHGLKSSFNHFLEDYLSKVLQEYKQGGIYEDEFLNIPVGINDTWNFNPIKNSIDAFDEMKVYFPISGNVWKSTFMKYLIQSIRTNNWVDVEKAYFTNLKNLLSNQSYRSNPYTIEDLNKDLNLFKNKFLTYLSKEVQKLQLEPSEQLFEQFIGPVLKRDVLPEIIKENKEPENTILLNFNYTDIALRYLNKLNSSWDHVYIHGQLDGDDKVKQAPVFGFGDELDKDYLAFEEKDDDILFEHIKSFKYLQFSNYRRLLDFIESSPYQILIFGHSCGLSDRTLLNTLFENENCISIKPYYHEYEEGDDYEQKSFAISKHFKSKPALRAKVVNREYCAAMVQPIK